MGQSSSLIHWLAFFTITSVGLYKINTRERRYYTIHRGSLSVIIDRDLVHCCIGLLAVVISRWVTLAIQHGRVW